MKNIFIYLSFLILAFVGGFANAQNATEISPEVTKNIQACEKGDGFSCTRVGVAYITGNNAPKIISEALKYYDLGCQKKEYTACTNLAEIYDSDSYGIKDAVKALKYYNLACDEHHALSCANAGYMYDTGLGTSENDDLALQKYVRGCDLGNEYGCDNAGILEDNIYDSEPKNLMLKVKKTKRYFYHQHACYMGLEIACNKQKTLPPMAQGPAVDSPLILQSHIKACYEYDGYACYEAGKILESDDYVDVIISIDTSKSGAFKAKDFQHARLLYMRGCDLGYAISCNSLAYRYINGQNVAANYKHSAHYALDACLLGDFYGGCNNTAIQYAEGYWYKVDKEAAKAFFFLSCQDGNDFACGKLNTLQTGGANAFLPTGVNAKAAKENCKKFDTLSCRKLGDFYKSGLEAPKNQIIANGYFAKACDLGDGQSCYNVALAFLIEPNNLQKIRARQILNASCNAGNIIACDKLKIIK
jgi:uncharacterized protein